ncbi:ankyrin repeat domain-containing protein [Chryseobacterium profundimaris]|uniref:Ankyrin repeat-containing protein n=1 Tax=Chryseobacterium profundimaris TaxID=1387275 RepID=A0ABY1PI95_9FLAO|nr:ankyrin repeat domain-containing protein [Chryseobacterium profundimaris]SMP32579.1 Ankyrin repeat-containing protein [Chryseobacterium profundimaris]
MDYLKKIITDFELHSVEGIRACFENGVNPNEIINGKPLIFELINMYSRGPSFKNCIQVFIDYGVEFDDKILLSVLADNHSDLDSQLTTNTSALHKKYTLNCTFTPLVEATLFHICAEYNHLKSAEVLLKHGANINAKAGVDENGFGGHTPIFHTVNQDANKSLDVLKLLLANDADLNINVKGLIWGKGYDWETFIPDVNPLSYSMMGLLRQFQRTEQQIYEVVSLLLKAKYDLDYFPANVPNTYLNN